MSLASYHCSTPGSVYSFYFFACLLERHHCQTSPRRRTNGRLLGLTTAVSLEDPSRREFAKLVAHHVLRDENLGELAAVMHQEREADKIGHDCAIAGPGLDRLATAGAVLPFDFREHFGVNVGAFFQ